MGVPDLSAKQLKKLFGSFPQSLCVIHAGEFIKVNSAFCNTVNYTEPDLLDKKVLDFIHPEDHEATLKALSEITLHDPAICFENRFLCKSLKYKWLSWNCFLSAENNQLYCSLTDISEKKETEANLARLVETNKRLLHSTDKQVKKVADESWVNTVEILTDGFFILNHDWTIQAFNQMAQSLINLPENILKLASFWPLFPADSELQLEAIAKDALETKKTSLTESFFPHLNQWLEITVYPSSDKVTLFIKDITQRKKQEIDLTQLEQDYEILFDNNPMPMWAYDVEQLKIVMVNDAALSLYGYNRSEFLNLSLFELRPESEHERLKNELDKKHLFKRHKLAEEWVHMKKDGSLIFVDIASHQINLNQQKIRLIVVNNITAQRKAQNKLLKQDNTLREIAQLSSHDLRGPVASILGLVSLFDEENQDMNLNNTIIENLKECATSLDKVIHAIVKKTYEDN